MTPTRRPVPPASPAAAGEHEPRRSVELA